MQFTVVRFVSALAVVALIGFAPVARAQNGDYTPAEKAQLKSYVLDAGKANRYIASLNAVAMAKASDPAIVQELEQIENEPGDTLADLRASFGRHPKIVAFFQRQNLTADDAVMLPLVLLMAGVAAAAPGQLDDTVSAAQVNFVKANGPLMQRLGQANDALNGDSR